MKTRVQKRKAEAAEPSLTEYRRRSEALKVEAAELELRVRKRELVERAAVKKFLSERGRLERDQWLAWASAAAARLAGNLGVDHGRLFAELEREVREHLLYLSENAVQRLAGAHRVVTAKVSRGRTQASKNILISP